MTGEKTGGRVAGTPNNSTKNIKEWIRNVVIGQQEQFERDLMMLSPRERVQAIEKLLQYVAPRVQAIDLSEDGDENRAIALLKQMASYDEELLRQEGVNGP